MERVILHNDNPNSYREAIEQNGCVLGFTKGVSMVPLIREGKNYVAVERLDTDPKVNDILLFEQVRNGEKKCILHRLVKIQKDVQGMIYVTRGDNCVGCEYISREDIIGRVVAIYSVKGGRVKKPCEPMYMAFLQIWRCNSLRKWTRRLYRLFSGQYFKKR